MSDKELLFESTAVDSITAHNLGDFTVVVRENKQLTPRAVTINTIGYIPKGTLTVDNKGKRVRLKNNKESRRLLNLSTDAVSENNGTVHYANGLTVTKEFTDSGIVVTYQPQESEESEVKMTIIIEVYDMLTHVTVDGDSVDLWPRHF
jgi:hypothetical protein